MTNTSVGASSRGFGDSSGTRNVVRDIVARHDHELREPKELIRMGQRAHGAARDEINSAVGAVAKAGRAKKGEHSPPQASSRSACSGC